MSRFPGNIIKLPNVTPTQSSASGVWSLKDQMVYQRNNLWPFQRDPYFNYTTLLLQGNVPNTTGPQAMTLPLAYNADASTNNFLVTPNGDVGPRPFSPYFNNYSGFFESTASYVRSTSNVAAISGDFTIEGWVFWSASSGAKIIAALSSDSIDWWINAPSGTISYYTGAATRITTSAVVPQNSWTHVALVRSSGVTKIYINGVADGATYSSSATIGSGSEFLYVGRDSGTSFMAGYLSNVRLVIGRAVYTSNFVPETIPLGATTGGQNPPQGTETKLLILQSNRFIDNATSGLGVSVVGTPRITDNSPFVSTDFTTGAGYFTGAATDYFRIADNAALDMGSGSFTIECFYYPAVSITTAQGSAVFGKRATGGTYGGVTGEFYETYAPKFVSTVNGSSWGVNITSSILCVQNQWNHIAWVRNGDAWTIYVNGQAGGSVNLSGTIPDNTADFTIGATESSASSYKLRQGYLSDFRVVKGAAVYTGNFTPPSLGMLRTSGAASAAAYPSTTNVNTSFAESATSLLTLQTRAPSQNINFIDSSPNEFIVTKNGNTTQGTFSPFSPTGWGNYFNGSNYLSFAHASLSANFTIEFWVYRTVGSTLQSFVFLNSGSTNGAVVYVDASNYLVVTDGSVAQSPFTGQTIPINAWTHIAVVRSSGTTTGYINGSSVGSNGFTPQAVNSVNIAYYVSANPLYLTGYVSNVRIVNGQALYTGNFTPAAAPLTASSVGTSGANVASSITGTVSLLTCQSNRFVNNASNASPTAIVNSPSVQAFSPFAPANAVSPLVTGGSGYFDGGASSSSDYLNVTSSSLYRIEVNTTWTIECWVYALSLASTPVLITNTTNGASTGHSLYLNAGVPTLTQFGNAAFASTATINANAWNHIAVVCNSNSGTFYVNGSTAGTFTWGSGSAGGPLFVGAGYTGSNTLNGYISGVRYVVGSIVVPSGVPTTPPTAIPNTSLLLNFTNGAAVDATGKNNLETVANSGVQTTVIKYGNGSMYFDRTDDYLKPPPSQLYAFGTGDFTVECWVRFLTTTVSNGQGICQFDTAYLNSTTNGPAFGTNHPSGKWAMYVGATPYEASTLIPAINTWYHVALVRYSGTTKLYVDGTAVPGLSQADTNNYTRQYLTVGGWYSTAYLLNGYISNFRVTRFARYTSDFNTNLPSGPFPIG